MTGATPDDLKPQLHQFRDLARQLAADEDLARFAESVRKIAPKASTPPPADDA